jgi:hypothetical protein
MSTALIADLSASNLAAIEVADIASLGTQQIRALSGFQMGSLANAQLSALTTTQTHAMTASQYNALSAAQQAAFSAAQKAAMTFVTPLVLDLDGNGVRTLGLEAGVRFDLAASGETRATGWVGGGDGLLVLDRNHDGIINDGGELFGSATRLADGSSAGNGYVALAAIDSNADGVVDAKDSLYGDLRVWVDGNADGVSQAAELKTLAELHIASLNLDARRDGAVDNGNLIGLSSTYTTDDGQQHAAADVWFAQGRGGQASAMAQAMSAFDAGAAAGPLSLAMPQPAAGMGAHAARMADALQRFSLDGQTAGTQLSDHETLRLKALQPSATPGLLAAPR